MRSTKIINIISCHAEGEVGNVIVGGVPDPPGESILHKSNWIDQDQRLRKFVLNEQRGGVLLFWGACAIINPYNMRWTRTQFYCIAVLRLLQQKVNDYK